MTTKAMFSGYNISIEVNGNIVLQQFVIPAILDEAIAAMTAALHDEYTVRVRWEQQATRPLYAIEPAYRYEPGITWPSENAGRAFADVWKRT